MKRILLLFALVSCLGIQNAIAQSRTVKGQVMDASGESAVGAAVKIKGTTTGTVTDVDGRFELTLPDGAGTLEIRSLTGETEEIKVDAEQKDVTITLKKSEQAIDEVQIYGRQMIKATDVGSAGRVTSEDIAKRPVTSITKALEGQVAGLQTTSGGGQPGSNALLSVRGTGSLSASSAPLIVVDGAVYAGDLITINPSDVSTVDVLKDATATAIYGARGANGVILITTKRGKKSDKPRINVDGQIGIINRMIPEYKRVGMKDYYETYYDMLFQTFVNQLGGWSGISDANMQLARTVASQRVIGLMGNYNAYNVPNDKVIDDKTGKLNPNATQLYNDDWQKGLLRTGLRQNYNLSVSNGDDKSDYYLSVGYLNEKGIVQQSGYERFSTRLNVNSKITSWLRSGINLSGTYDKQRFFVSSTNAYVNPFMTTRIMGPAYPLYRYDSLGNRMTNPDGSPVYDFGTNPDGNNPSKLPQNRPFGQNTNVVASLYYDDRSNNALTGVGVGYLEATFLKDFTARTNINLTYTNLSQNSFQNSLYGDATNVNGRFNRQFQNQIIYTWNQLLTWKPSFGPFNQGHNLVVILGHENFLQTINNSGITKIGFSSNGFREGDAAAATESGSSSVDYLAIESYLSQATYDYKKKYLLQASFRRDGNSRFSPDNRWGNFWSVGGGWRISEEPFFRDAVSWVDELKLKASYGVAGNENIGDFYAYLPRYSFGFANNINPGYVFSTWGNSTLRWEGSYNFSAGFDFAIFKRRLEGTIEYFVRGSNDLLFVRPLAPSTGASAIQENIGDMRNRGIEVTLKGDAIRATNVNQLNWNISMNLTHFKNKITRQSQDQIAAGSNILKEGGSLYDFYFPKYAGVDPANGDELWYINVNERGEAVPAGTTTNSTTVANMTANRVYQGTAIPDLYGAITNTFTYKNFDLSFMVSFGLGGKYWDQVYQNLMQGNYQAQGQTWSTDILNRWQKPGDITDVPRVDYSNNKSGATSDRYLVSNTYANIKNISLGYTFPVKLTQKAKMQSLRIYAQADNIWVFAARQGMDPQQNFSGTSDFVYYPYRTVMIGLNLGL